MTSLTYRTTAVKHCDARICQGKRICGLTSSYYSPSARHNLCGVHKDTQADTVLGSGLSWYEDPIVVDRGDLVAPQAVRFGGPTDGHTLSLDDCDTQTLMAMRDMAFALRERAERELTIKINELDARILDSVGVHMFDGAA